MLIKVYPNFQKKISNNIILRLIPANQLFVEF